MEPGIGLRDFARKDTSFPPVGHAKTGRRPDLGTQAASTMLAAPEFGPSIWRHEPIERYYGRDTSSGSIAS